MLSRCKEVKIRTRARSQILDSSLIHPGESYNVITLNTVIREISTRVGTNGLLHVRHKVGRRRAAADLGHLDIKVWHQSELRVFPIRYDSIWRRHRLKLLLLQSLYKRTCLIRAIHIQRSVVLTWWWKEKMNTASSGTKFPQPKRHVSTFFPTAIVAILSFDTLHKRNDFESIPINKLKKNIVVNRNWPSWFRELDSICCGHLSKPWGSC